MTTCEHQQFFRVERGIDVRYISVNSILHIQRKGLRGKPVGWTDDIEASVTLTGGVEVPLTYGEWVQFRSFVGIEE